MLGLPALLLASLLICFLLLGQAAVNPSERSAIPSFKVMDVMAAAQELEAKGENIIHLEVGQPSTGAPSLVLEAAREILSRDKIGYTQAVGIDAIRERISKHYADMYGTKVAKERIIITTGSSAAFIFAFLGCFDLGAHVGLCSSGYPCYRNDLKALGLHEASIKVNSEFKVTAVELQQEVDRRAAQGLPRLSGFICSSPSNPTGAMLTPTELKDICDCCARHNIVFVSDEIYHGISYGKTAVTAASYSDDAIVVNSFSKYYSMTGWRLGWMAVPLSMVDTFNRLSQNLYINAPTISQLAGLKAFDCKEELETHVKKYAENRRVVLETLQELGLLGGASPADGAFYVYVDLLEAGIGSSSSSGRQCIMDAPTLCDRLLQEAKVAVTPGVDFESAESGLGLQRVRFSYSRSTDEVSEGMRRLKEWWLKNMK